MCLFCIPVYYNIIYKNMKLIWTETMTFMDPPFFWVAQLDIRFSAYFTQNFISWYVIVVQLSIFSFAPIFLILNHKASLLMESNAFSESTKHRYNFHLFAFKFLSTCFNYKNIYCSSSFSKSNLKQSQFFL